jgi:hypothetical protein
MDVQTHVLLTSALVSGEWSASRPDCFFPGIRVPGTDGLRGSEGPRAGLEDVEGKKILPLAGLEIRPLGRVSL